MMKTKTEWPCITSVRLFRQPRLELGIRRDGGLWFVYMRGVGFWEKHCGPYSTSEQAIAWIRALTAPKSGDQCPGGGA
jgi:hypothetical protein